MPEETARRFWVDIEAAPETAVVLCHGRLVAGVSDELYAHVRPLLTDRRRIVLDLTDLTHMDSMGLGVLLRLYASAGSAGCTLELINIGERILNLLGITKVLSLFTSTGETDARGF